MGRHPHNTSKPAAGLMPRAERVCILVGLAASLGLADLWLTVFFMRTTGMVELNPVARLLAGWGPAGLVVFKAASLLVHGAVLGTFRRRASAELAAWISVLLMAALTAHWHMYVNASAELTCCETAMLACDAHYVKLAD